MREDPAARMMGRRLGGDDEDAGEGGRLGRIYLGEVGGYEEVGDGGGLCGTGGVEELRAVEGERSRVGGESREGDVLDPIAGERVADGAGRVEEGNSAYGEERCDEDQEER